MRLTTKFSAFVTLLTGLTIFVTLLGCSLSFYNAIQYKFSHRVQAVATAIDTHLVSNDFSVLRPQITELMMSADIVRVDLLHGDKQVYTLARNGSYRPVGSSDLFRELSVPLIKHPGMSLRLVYQDPMGNYFHSLMTTAPLTGAIGFIIVMLFLAVRWLQRQLAGQELLETRATRILNGERGSNVLGTIYEWPPRTSSALDTLLREIQNAREQHSRLDTLIRSYAAQDVKTGLNNRLFFDNQLATLLEDQEKVGTHGIVMMIRLPDFNMLSDTWGHSQVEEQFFTLTNLLSTFMMRYPGALLARYHRSDFAALLPHRTLKEAESIAGQLIKAVDTLPNNKMLDRDDMIHIGICAWRSGQDTEQVMEHAESATRNAGLRAAIAGLFTMTRCLKKDAVMFAGVRLSSKCSVAAARAFIKNRRLLAKVRFIIANSCAASSMVMKRLARRSICRWSCSLAYRKSMTVCKSAVLFHYCVTGQRKIWRFRLPLSR